MSEHNCDGWDSCPNPAHRPSATTLTDFLLARIAEDEAPTWRLLPYDCPPDCCAPAGYVGHECLICGEVSFGGTPEAITEISQDHDEKVHRRSRVLAECEAKRRIVEEHGTLVMIGSWQYPEPRCQTCADWDDADYDGPPTVELPCPTLRFLALPYADHPDYRKEWKP